MNRRQFLSTLAAVAADPMVRVPGSVLVHEHVLVDFIGAEKAGRDRYALDEVVRVATPKLLELKAHGCVRLLECTPNGLGRDARLLARLQDATGVELWTNTGLYGAAKRSGLYDYAWKESARELANRWVREYKQGMDGAKPRFIKTAVNGFPLEDIDRKLIEAAAITSLETGLPIASHTNGGAPAAEAQLEILRRVRCPLDKFIWVHAQSEKSPEAQEAIARAGAWVELDGISEASAARHRECVLHLHAKGLLGRVLISQDAGWYRVGEPGGGNYRGYTYIYSGFLPTLSSDLWKPLLVDNPRRAFGT
ncbi:MAG: phosphotriesterase [Bryobacterales bacterium]|nr:phosphotriesterase [Bryobacterales bacterium]